MTEELAGCPGQYMPLRGYNAAICLGCARYSRRSKNQIAPAAECVEHGVWRCDNKPRPAVVKDFLTPEQIAAMDETAGLR